MSDNKEKMEARLENAKVDRKAQIKKELEALRKARRANLRHQDLINDGPPFRFQDLSAELRNAVYEFALTSPGTLIITKRYDTVGHCWEHHPPHSKRRIKISLSPNLLVTCKTIHSEATSILYGANKFELDWRSWDKRSPASWLDTLDTSLRFLRKIDVGSAANQRTITSLLETLQEAKSLQTLTCSFTGNFQTRRSMAAALFPLVLILHRDRKGTTDQRAALDVIEFNRRRSWERQGEYGDMGEVKDMLEKRLGAFDKASSGSGD